MVRPADFGYGAQKKMKTIPDGEGTLFDRRPIVWVNEVRPRIDATRALLFDTAETTAEPPKERP